jgi:eukaryotic-like serine/threonine-protein kinase
MSPEQANGNVANLDRRADVFGLGGILCEILTGRPPYVGRSAEEVRRKAANGDLADATARLDGCGADPELLALTKQCLAPEAADRPRDAQALADGLSAYLNGVQERLQAAQRERAVAVAQEAEQRKRRKVQLALAAAVVALLLGGGGFAWWRHDQAQLVRQRDARNADAVAALLDQCEEALRAGDAAKAAVVLEAAGRRSAEGGAEGQAERLGRLDADLALLRDLDAVDQLRWTHVGKQFAGHEVVAARARAALTRFGADPDAVPADEAAARVSASVVRERLVTVLDRWLFWPERTAGVRAVLGRVDENPYRDAVRDAVLANDRAKVVALLEQKAAPEQPPGFVAILGEYMGITVERRRQLLEAAVTRRPGHLGLLVALANTYPYDDEDVAAERLRWLQAAVAAAPTNPAAHNDLGLALGEKGQVEEAIAWFEKAIAHYNLGSALQGKGQVDEAITSYRKATELTPDFAEAHCNLGHALAGQGRFAESLAALRRGHELGSKRSGWPHPSAGWVRQAEANAALEAKLPALLKGEFRPGDNGERLALAAVCQAKKLPHAATDLYAAAFAADPKLADDVKAAHRYNAARNAALAAAGQGEDAARLDDPERSRLRKQALDWLRADLGLRGKQLEGDKPADHTEARQALRYWQTDADLAGIRDKEALARLPAEEQKAFAQLWADVAATLQKAEQEMK